MMNSDNICRIYSHERGQHMLHLTNRDFLKSWLVFLLVLVIFSPEKTQAHSGSTGYSEVNIEGQEMVYDLYLLADLVGGLLLIDENQDGYMKENEIKGARKDIEKLILEQVHVELNHVEQIPTIKNIELTKRWNHDMFHIELEYPQISSISSYKIDYNLFFNEVDPKHQNFATVVFNNVSNEYVLDASTHIIEYKNATNRDLSDISAKSVGFGDYLMLGMKHIWSGIDHLLFILALILARATTKDYIKIITAFTVGHSITLCLAALEILSIPSTIIEPLIALSIVYIAFENFRKEKTKWRWLVALGFGLIHGFGFAEVLRGTLDENFVLPLLSFNLGVEVGQLAVLLALIPLMKYVSNTTHYMKMVYSTSGIISLLGLFWFFERVL